MTNTFSSSLVSFLIHVDLHYMANMVQENKMSAEFISIELKYFLQYNLLIFELGIKAFQDFY